jgi:DNA-binding Xre family transcriptional regulator
VFHLGIFDSHDSGATLLRSDELLEALAADHRENLFIGGSVDPSSRTITLWRGTLEPLTVPFRAFELSGDGTAPDFSRFAITDCGQTVQLGDYEAATDALLYEFDPEYRRRVNRERLETEQSFGAALWRLRKLRGLSREDFAPEVAAKTIARIERGEVQRIQKKTLEALARRLQVRPEDIATF